MRRIIQQQGEKGSLKWIQYILNDHPNFWITALTNFYLTVIVNQSNGFLH